MEPRSHHSVTSIIAQLSELRPTMTHKSPRMLTYTHGLVFTLPPANYSRETLKCIDHIHISILPRFAHTVIKQYISTFVTQQKRAYEQRFPRL